MSQRRACDFTPQPYNIRNTTANLLNEVRKDVSVEPQLQPLRGEKFSEKTSNNSDQARVDISARGFWLTGQVVFFDVRVFNPTAKRYVNQELRKSYEVNEKEKKKQYNERILQVEHGTFTPLVMSTGGMGHESRTFYARLSEMISKKRKENYALIASWIRRKLSFALENSLCICLRGSGSVYCTSNTNSEESVVFIFKGSRSYIKCWCNFTILLSFIYYINCMLLLH